jgi:hypothetical protein
MLILGFSGTRFGMSIEQYNVLKTFLKNNDFRCFCHGDCLGADLEFHNLVLQEFIKCYLYIYPPKQKKLRAYMAYRFKFFNSQQIIQYKEKNYLERNRDIVNNSDFLIAAPKSKIENGGTWYTINYAKTIGKSCMLIFPSGECRN